MSLDWSELPDDLVRLVVRTAKSATLLGRLACTCRSFKRCIYDSIDLWKTFGAFFIDPNTILEPATVSQFQRELNKSAAVRRRIHSGQANVSTVIESHSPYIREEAIARRRDSSRYGEYDSYDYTTFEIFQSFGSNSFLLLRRIEESGSSWSMRSLISAQLLSAKSPDTVLADVPREDEFEDVQSIVNSRFIARRGQTDSDTYFYDIETGDSFTFDAEDSVNQPPMIEAFYEENRGNRSLFAVFSQEDVNDNVCSFLSICNLETREFAFKRRLLPVADSITAVKFINDVLFLCAENTTICIKIGQEEDETKLSTEIFTLPCAGSVLDFSHSHVTMSKSHFGTARGSGEMVVTMLAFPSGEIIRQRRFRSDPYYTTFQACGPYLAVSASDHFEIHNLLGGDENEPLLALSPVNEFHFLSPGRWILSQMQNLYCVDFESRWTPRESLVTCFASARPSIASSDKTSGYGNRVDLRVKCAFIDISANALLDQVASLLGCSVDELSMRINEASDKHALQTTLIIPHPP